jgi:hypothetical protein
MYGLSVKKELPVAWLSCLWQAGKRKINPVYLSGRRVLNPKVIV